MLHAGEGMRGCCPWFQALPLMPTQAWSMAPVHPFNQQELTTTPRSAVVRLNDLRRIDRATMSLVPTRSPYGRGGLPSPKLPRAPARGQRPIARHAHSTTGVWLVLLDSGARQSGGASGRVSQSTAVRAAADNSRRRRNTIDCAAASAGRRSARNAIGRRAASVLVCAKTDAVDRRTASAGRFGRFNPDAAGARPTAGGRPGRGWAACLKSIVRVQPAAGRS